MNLEWVGKTGDALDVLQSEGSYIVCVFPSSIEMWDTDNNNNNRTRLPWPEGMEFGDELRDYVVAQYKLIVGG